MTTFDKAVLVERLMDHTGERRDLTQDHFDHALKLIMDRLIAGHTISLKGFGRIEVVATDSLRDGSWLPKGVSHTVLFSPDPELLLAVNG